MNQSQGSFSINEAKCPSCDGALDLSSGADVVTCPFCGSTIHVSFSHSSETSGVEPDGTIRDRATGYGLFRVRSFAGWLVTGSAIQQRGTASRPYIPEVELRDRAGGVITVRMGEAGTRRSAGMSALMGVYGGHLAGIDTTNYADMPDPIMLADTTAANLARSFGAADLRFAGQFAHPDLEGERERGCAKLQQLAQSQGGRVGNPFGAVVLRTYELSCSGQPWKMAVYIALAAVKDASGVGEGFGAGMMDGIGDLMGSLGSLFGGSQAGGSQQGHMQGEDPYGGVMGFLRGGGLVGKMKRDRQAAAGMQQTPMQPQPMMAQQGFGGYGQPQQGGQTAMQAQAQQQLSTGVAWCVPSFSEYVQGGTIYWSVSPLVTFAAPAVDFDAQFNSMFIPFASTLDVHPDVERLAMTFAQQEAARIQSATQSQLARNQSAFEAQQAAHRQTQAAFDSYNQSISDARNAHHQQFMASSREQFGHAAPDYSEAIRGVNTYTTSDGRQVELSVHADRAYENQAGDVIGASGSFDPGANWTEIPRT